MSWLVQRLAPAVLAVSLVLSCASSDDKSEQTTPEVLAEQTKSQDSLVIEDIAVDSLTVLELLQAHHQVEFRSSAVGAFVTSINSITSSEDLFWLYSVNSVKGQVACDRFRAGAGDTVRWHFRRVGQ